MATDVLASRRALTVNRGRERVFFGVMTLLLVGTILLGFRRTYFPLGPKPEALASWVIVVHGVLFSLYLALFFVQTVLVAVRRVKWHMSLGLAVYGLALAMLPMGVWAAADSERRGLAAGQPYFLEIDPATFSIVSVMGMVMFGTLLGWSYWMRRRPDAHKRLALFATISMMDAGCDRWPWDAWHVSEGWSKWVYTGLLLMPVLYDLVSVRRVHWATMMAAPYAWVLHAAEIPLGRTAAWHWVAAWMLKVFP